MKKLMLIIVLGISTNTFADSVWCRGTLEQVSNHVPGGLYIKLSSTNVIKICSFEVNYLRQTPESCNHLASLAAQAFAQETRISMLIDNVPASTCLDMPNWFGADVRYFAMTK